MKIMQNCGQCRSLKVKAAGRYYYEICRNRMAPKFNKHIEFANKAPCCTLFEQEDWTEVIIEKGGEE